MEYGYIKETPLQVLKCKKTDKKYLIQTFSLDTMREKGLLKMVESAFLRQIFTQILFLNTSVILVGLLTRIFT